ncbi:hypothetical protein [Paenibacillus agilis]|uniref:DUF4367 domain-containing protein n=1 Tax=Paenibacillus agilis TaxID=3020863 RepID=A0A559IPV2_9BACL|nr:hypothetical protein [Paenibacillus agilis]TVX89672.1 hypothetical protein FPZ44_18080 [Paenibacillus agilis]
MSIETKLKKEFEQYKQAVSCPPSVDSRMMALYRSHMVQTREGPSMLRKWNLPRLAVITVLAATLLGFTYAGMSFLFEESKGNISVTMSAISEEVTLNKEQLTSISRSLADVKEQLQIGENALVYFADLEGEEVLQGKPLFPVSRPAVNENLENWKLSIPHAGVADSVPSNILDDFLFEGGMKGSPFGLFFSDSFTETLDELKRESKDTGKKVVWRKEVSSSEGPLNIFTSIYRNSKQQAIYVGVETSSEKISIKGIIPSSSSYETLNINGSQAHYTRDDNSLFSTSLTYQEVMWMEIHEGQTFVYRVASDSSAITKEQLVQAAKGL